MVPDLVHKFHMIYKTELQLLSRNQMQDACMDVQTETGKTECPVPCGILNPWKIDPVVKFQS